MGALKTFLRPAHQAASREPESICLSDVWTVVRVRFVVNDFYELLLICTPHELSLATCTIVLLVEGSSQTFRSLEQKSFRRRGSDIFVANLFS